MGNAKTNKKGKNENTKEDVKKLYVSFYPEEFEQIIQYLKDIGNGLVGNTLNSRDIRILFGLKPTHKRGIKGELKNEIKTLSLEQQKELLEEIKNRKKQ